MSEKRKTCEEALTRAGWKLAEPPYDDPSALIGVCKDERLRTVAVLCWPEDSERDPGQRFLVVDAERNLQAYVSEVPSPQEAVEILLAQSNS